MNHWVVLAPMAGITNLPFRLMVKGQGAALVFTEMVSAKGLTLKQARTMGYLKTDPMERPLAAQIFGSEPLVMAKAAELIWDMGLDVLDINVGCPVKRVTKTGAGAALLASPEQLIRITREVRRAWPGPLTAKLRAGWKRPELVAPEIAKQLEEAGVDALTIHPRYAKDGLSGKSDWSIIRRVKASVSIPVIGNGDVFRPEDAIKMKETTGCDGVMIGRGAIGNPWIFRQIRDMGAGTKPIKPDLKERREFIVRHFQLLSKFTGQERAARMMRGLLFWYTKGLPHSGRFRGSIGRIKDIKSLHQAMDTYFAALEDQPQ